MGTDYTLQQPKDTSLHEALDETLGPTRIRLGGVLQAANVDEVQRLVQAAHRYGASVGVGNTGMAHQLTVSLSELTEIRDLDSLSGLVTVESGCPIATLEEALAAEGLGLAPGHFPDPAQKVGDAISDGEGGPLVVSVGGILPDGMLFHTPLAPRRATGPNPDALLTGSGHRLAIVVWVTLRVGPLRTTVQRMAFRGGGHDVLEATRELLLTGGIDGWVCIRKGKAGKASATWCLYGEEKHPELADAYQSASANAITPGSGPTKIGRPRRVLWSEIAQAMKGTGGAGLWVGPMDAHGGWLRQARRKRPTADALLARVASALDPQGTLKGVVP